MHRLLVDSSQLEMVRPVLSKEALKHLKILRPEPGEEIELFDGAGAFRRFEWRDALVAKGEVQIAPRTDGEIILFACITKGSRWDWTLEKATELGATKIVPVISDRTIVRIPIGERKAKRERWQRIIEDAARQSDAKYLPELLEPVNFKESLKLVKTTKCLIGALTNPPSPMIGSEDGNAVFIGPEGDFTPEELASLMEIATPVSFGPSILRAETAAIFALSVIKASKMLQQK